MLKFISNHDNKHSLLNHMAKYAIIGLLAINGLSAFANTAEQKTFEQAVDNAIYTHINARHNILTLVSAYAYENVDIATLPLEDIKLYTVFDPKVLQCVYHHSQHDAYKIALKQSLQSYYQQVDDKQFKQDLAFITDKKRQELYNLQKQAMKLYAQLSDTSSGETISTADKVLEIERQLQALNDKYPDMMPHDWGRDIDRLMNDETRQPLLNLLGLSPANMPFDEESQDFPVSPMSVYAQNVIDECHRPIWQHIHQQGSYEDL